MKRAILASGIIIIAVVFITVLSLHDARSQAMPFGGTADVDFANKAWEQLNDYEDWKMQSDYYEGQSPHGDVVKVYYSMITVDDEPYHVIAKDNFVGDGLAAEQVAENPDEYFASATIMIQREEGYDPPNDDWFWVKYDADGAVMENPNGTALAGRVAKGSGQGCIACHANARDNDYLFSNDR